MHISPVAHPPPPTRSPVAGRAALSLALVSLLLLTLVAGEWGPLIALDEGIARTTHRWAVEDPGTTHFFRILTDWVWDPLTLRILCAVVIVWLVWRQSAWFTAWWLLVTVAIGTLVQQGLKAAVGRERPVWPDPVDSAHYAAFPSGHAMTATVICGLLFWLLRQYGAPAGVLRTAATVAVVSVIGVGLTRIWLGVHWFTDVVGGWLLGAMLVTAAIAVHNRRRSVAAEAVEPAAEPDRSSGSRP
ncbi:phosphatase PAP2 family protein [Streptomyces sp. NPDC088387]|uniref:phosphatase PAP2 family protein n=1 Tax=Streptomyces sp. NPDC088387 TaxID=3365859 RepID=UPI003806D3CE